MQNAKIHLLFTKKKGNGSLFSEYSILHLLETTYAHHPHEPHGSATAWPTLTSTLSTYTYPTPNPSTSNLNHLHLSIYLPHTHMQVSGSWRVLLHIEPPSTLTLSYKLGLGGLQLMFLDALKCYKQNFLFTRDFN